MKNKFLISFRDQPAAGGLFLGLALLLCASASAQNLLKNGDFESPFPISDPTNGWSLVYVDGGPSDFAIAGQSTEASAGGGGVNLGGRGAHFRANNWNFAHAYFKQVVTNLTQGAGYTLSCLKMKAGWQSFVDNGKLKVYMTAISGSTTTNVFGDGTIVGPYSLIITCSASKQIEVQLHMAKGSFGPGSDSADQFKSAQCWAHFDEFSLTLTP